MNNTWLLFDANYLCYRARYTMGGLTFKGSATGVVYGFLQTILVMQDFFKTNQIAFCFDSKHSKRRAVYPTYKMNRKQHKEQTAIEIDEEIIFKKQIVALRRKYLPAIGYKNVFVQRGYEADDLIAQICKQNRTTRFIIITADQDMYQCLTHKVMIFSPVKRKMMTLRKFNQAFKINPSEWATVKSLAGCSSDNIKGIAGVGETRALQYLREELKPTTQAFKKIQQFKKCNKSDLLLNKKLVTLPYPGTKVDYLGIDRVTQKKWNQVCRKLGISTLRFEVF